ncbi:MAG: monofunctional biosynthetic peptidoglycan transglycosylase [Smithellaceae bacterium]|nr:monofunctional biosynthetic peptidoglycan transglycosylase [Smithellaceae bacterium]
MKRKIKWGPAVIGTIFLLFLLNVGFYLVYPNVTKLRKENPRKTSFMEYREEQWQDAGKKRRIRQNWVKLSHVSPYMIKAVIIAEDDHFWSHDGFDFEAMQKALEKDLKKKKLKAGGSTISQQLAKNLYLSPSKNPVRKVKEAILTWRIERNLSKRRIMELYLNVAEWGDGLFGVEAAARRYFGKTAADLSAYEAARLAAALPNPIRFSPVGASRFIASRSARIYSIMVRRGIVIPEYDEILSEPEEQPEDLLGGTLLQMPAGETTISGGETPTGEPQPPEEAEPKPIPERDSPRGEAAPPY